MALKDRFSFVLVIAIVIFAAFGCSKVTNMMGGDKLYFCESYEPSSDNCKGESTKYTTGALTVMVKLSKPIGASDVNINVTDKSTNEVVETYPFTVDSNKDYIFFPDVAFTKTGNYKVSCIKKDGTVIVTNDIEIVSK